MPTCRRVVGCRHNNPVAMGTIISVDEANSTVHYHIVNLPGGNYFAAAGVWVGACGPSDLPTAIKTYGEPPVDLAIDLAGQKVISGVDFTFFSQDLLCP